MIIEVVKNDDIYSWRLLDKDGKEIKSGAIRHEIEEEVEEKFILSYVANEINREQIVKRIPVKIIEKKGKKHIEKDEGDEG